VISEKKKKKQLSYFTWH